MNFDITDYNPVQWVITLCYIISPWHRVEAYENLNCFQFFDLVQQTNGRQFLKLSGDYLLCLE